MALTLTVFGRGGLVMVTGSPQSTRTWLAFVISLAALAIALVALFQPTPTDLTNATSGATTGEDSLRRTKREHRLRVGYGGYPPYTIIDANEKDPQRRVSGFCVDMVNEIARRQTPPWTVEWHKLSWETLRADLYSGKFDVLADGVYETIPRASEVSFTEPFSYFGVAVGLVRKDETRFQKFSDLNRPDVRVSLAVGWTATEYAQQNLPQAQLRIIPIGDDPNLPFNDVIQGRADISLQDVATILQFTREHPDTVKALWIDNPPLRVGAGFVTRQGDQAMLEFLNTAIRAMHIDGTLARLDQKWKTLGEFPDPRYRLGAGFAQ